MTFSASHHRDLSSLTAMEVNDIIGMAWADDVSFDDIRRKYGLLEKEVIALMKKSLKPSSYRLWRRRVTGRKAKHDARLRPEGRENNSLQALLAAAYADDHDDNEGAEEGDVSSLAPDIGEDSRAANVAPFPAIRRDTGK